ncbi:hypothetical protein DDB_G0275435, partial [Dictyostelium discoideum AX4]
DILLILFQLKFVKTISNKIENQIVTEIKKKQFFFLKHYKSSLQFIKNISKSNKIIADLEITKSNLFVGKLRKSQLLGLFGLNSILGTQ